MRVEEREVMKKEGGEGGESRKGNECRKKGNKGEK